jgi:MFS transporter, PHS family, inorganic phosphate transporter
MASNIRERLRALKFYAVAGSGLFGDGYLNITISLVVPMLGYLYYAHEKSTVPTVQQDLIKGALAIGMICGQLFFGVFGDTLGRGKMYGKEMVLTIVGTLLVILMPWGSGFEHAGIVAWMFVSRMVTGMGTGGDYPMTSAISAERGLTVSRSTLILTIFSSIGLGSTVAALVFVILLVCFKYRLEAGHIEDLQYVWRLLLGLGLIPLLGTLYARFMMPETKSYEDYVSKGEKKRNLGNQFEDFRAYFGQPRHAAALFGVCASWFLFDIGKYRLV